MKKLLIATTNPGKLGEIRQFLSDLPLALVGLNDLGIKDRVEETGKTFTENAIIKAKFYARISGLPTLADDGGLEIDTLNGEPGIKSHRWLSGDRDDSDEELISYTLKRLERVPLEKRGAQMRVVLALVFPDGQVYTSEAKIRGVIPLTPSPHRTRGYPYRSLLFLPELGKFYNHDELTPAENDRYNHRKQALEKLKPIIRQKLCLT
ncbi:MAG: non-canonical purine NTP pyrophosphatase [Patescibacteria group bacterium]